MENKTNLHDRPDVELEELVKLARQFDPYWPGLDPETLEDHAPISVTDLSDLRTWWGPLAQAICLVPTMGSDLRAMALAAADDDEVLTELWRTVARLPDSDIDALISDVRENAPGEDPYSDAPFDADEVCLLDRIRRGALPEGDPGASA